MWSACADRARAAPICWAMCSTCSNRPNSKPLRRLDAGLVARVRAGTYRAAAGRLDLDMLESDLSGGSPSLVRRSAGRNEYPRGFAHAPAEALLSEGVPGAYTLAGLSAAIRRCATNSSSIAKRRLVLEQEASPRTPCACAFAGPGLFLPLHPRLGCVAEQHVRVGPCWHPTRGSRRGRNTLLAGRIPLCAVSFKAWSRRPAGRQGRGRYRRWTTISIRCTSCSCRRTAPPPSSGSRVRSKVRRNSWMRWMPPASMAQRRRRPRRWQRFRTPPKGSPLLRDMLQQLAHDEKAVALDDAGAASTSCGARTWRRSAHAAVDNRYPIDPLSGQDADAG